MELQSDAHQASSPHSPRSYEGRRAPRSRNGCWTCRTKKVKCDESRPQCRRCLRLKLLCDYTPRRKAFKIGRQIVQSQRRRPAADTASTDSVPRASPTSEWFQSLLRQDEAKSIPTFHIPVPATSTSSVALTASDHEAIRYFRTTFAKLHHTKNPDYSLYSIMFKIAEVNPGKRCKVPCGCKSVVLYIISYSYGSVLAEGRFIRMHFTTCSNLR
ncbi:hypothetical protein BDV41DRAFT_572527 [Aspergillus transmontanensis]|uniref:Zn(2)-C6 fungal-type domain-containing protein n=1 Tax=Aspergillus transmontanensis TaxID=1034304 RepID=A0A5N6WAV5_9EURO|nr:hypothetical protein BDV41DRAFT_572527 [Aspergillus transmontanensis]